MHRRSFALSAAKTLTAALFTSTLAALFFPTPAAANPAEIGYSEQKILELHNAERSARGIRPLSFDSRLQQVAREWAFKLAAEGRIYHIDTLPARGLGFKAGGENIVYRAPSMTPDYAHIEWMKSDLHRKNLLDPAFSSAGVGLACASARGLYFTVAVVEFGADASPSASVPPLDPRVVTGDGMNGRAVTCKGFASPAPPAPLIGAPAPVTPAPGPVAPKPAPAPHAPKPVPVPPQIEVPPPGPPPVLPPTAPPVTAPPPVPVPPAPSPEPEIVPEPQPVVQSVKKPAIASAPPLTLTDSTKPVSDRDEPAIVSGLFFAASAISWLVSGMFTSRKIRKQRASAGGAQGKYIGGGVATQHRYR